MLDLDRILPRAEKAVVGSAVTRIAQVGILFSVLRRTIDRYDGFQENRPVSAREANDVAALAIMRELIQSGRLSEYLSEPVEADRSYEEQVTREEAGEQPRQPAEPFSGENAPNVVQRTDEDLYNAEQQANIAFPVAAAFGNSSPIPEL